MSQKVRFYLILDLIGVGITFLVRWLLVRAIHLIGEPWIQTMCIVLANVATVAVCLFILFFFLLYWWSDKKWTKVQQKFRRKKTK